MTYYATIDGHDISRARVERLSAKTLTGAKRQATAEFGDGYAHHTIVVFERAADDSQERVLAKRGMTEGGWRDWDV